MAASRRHLLDPNNLPAPSPRAQQSLTRVQRWVMSSLAVTTILHLAAGLLIAAAVVDPARTDARIGLSVIAGCFGALAVLSWLAIHQKKLVNPVVLVGFVPTVVFLYVVL